MKPERPPQLRTEAIELGRRLMGLPFRRIFLIVMDSVGIGALPDAPPEDEGAHTIDHICEVAGAPVAPRLMSLGLGNIEGVTRFPAAVVPEAAYGRMAERSAGKDTTTGHWELAGVPLVTPFPTFPNGFSDELLNAIAERAGVPGWLGNEAASGTEIIERLGAAHVQSGKPIVYTSADSVLQIAAHETHFGLDRLLALCEIAREETRELGIARVIARPFEDAAVSTGNAFHRTHGRRDYSLTPPRETLLDALKDDGIPVVGIGKIEDIFAGRGLTRSTPTAGNEDGMQRTAYLAEHLIGGLVFVNLVEFDSEFGHRRDPAGYRRALEEFDIALGNLEYHRRDDDLFILTADHGNDPTHAGHTDHTREYVPLLAYSVKTKDALDLGTRTSFADVAATVADAFRVDYECAGESFLSDLLR